MNEFIELQIISAVKEMLLGRVNEIIEKWEFFVPVIEFSKYANAVNPIISLSCCERSEKERIIRLDAYTLTITFNVPENEESEFFCYGYASAVCKALGETPTLGGVADRAVVTGKKYTPPKTAGCGQEWQAIITLRITVEEINNVS